jgi:hypothetical protein
MADFSTIVKPSNASLDLYCNSITTTAQSANYALAVLSSTTNQATVNPGTPVIINWATSQLQAYKNITIGGGDTTFTLEKIGTYLVDFSIALDMVANAGAQNSVNMLVNGSMITYDVGYGNNVSYYNYKATLKACVQKVSSAPVVISFSASTLVAPANHRYAQLSITKLE